jgi:integrase
MPRASPADPLAPFGVPPTRLTREHFALYRGYLDGLSDVQLHAAYGDSATDVRITRRLIVSLRGTLSVAARRAHDNEAAHLLRLRPGSIPLAEHPGAGRAPTLEAYRESVDPDGVYSESDLLELYQTDHPVGAAARTDRRVARNLRLRRRQAEALARMETQLVQTPSPEHRLEGWFEPAIAHRLEAAGIRTIADLLTFVDAHGHRWHARVPRVGPMAAQRIADWLTLHAASLRRRLSPRATTPRRQLTPGDPALARPRQSGIVPLEALDVPRGLDGSRGTNRAKQAPLLPYLTTDLRAVEAWLRTREASAHTARAYRREAERLMLWAIVEQGKPFSSLDASDCRHYIETFLRDPQPAARWVGGLRKERFHPDWRPFSAGLCDQSRETARSILRAMAAWLVGQRYWACNPFGDLPPIRGAATPDPAARSLSGAQWQRVLRAVSGGRYALRDHLALLLACQTGLRRAELAAMVTGDVRHDPGRGWTLDGANKLIPLPDALLELLRASLRARNLPDDLSACASDTPLLANLRTGERLTPDGIGQVFKRIFARAAAEIGVEDGAACRALRRATTHWMRHAHSEILKN